MTILAFYPPTRILPLMIKTVSATLFCLLAVLSVANADTPLELSMQRMGKAYKQLSLDLKAPVDASKPDYLALATTMKTEATTSEGLVPKKAAELPADQQAAMVDAYKKSMDKLSATIDTLTTAIQASQWDAANKIMADLKQQMFAGHKEFRKKDK
jgi:soluble cytochrome b562